MSFSSARMVLTRTRRFAVSGAALAASVVIAAVPSMSTMAHAQTPPQTEGPFYPNKLPLDTDNDLLVVNDGSLAMGDVTHLTGRILDKDGKPIKNAAVEIWQVRLDPELPVGPHRSSRPLANPLPCTCGLVPTWIIGDDSFAASVTANVGDAPTVVPLAGASSRAA